jgi:hypothetical protein
MTEIVSAKAEQVPKFREKLQSAEGSTIFAESMYEKYWGTGLDEKGTLNTDPKAWPGKNKLGFIMRKVVSSYARKLRISSLPRNTRSQHQAGEEQVSIDKFLREAKKQRKKNTDTSDD